MKNVINVTLDPRELYDLIYGNQSTLEVENRENRFHITLNSPVLPREEFLATLAERVK